MREIDISGRCLVWEDGREIGAFLDARVQGRRTERTKTANLFNSKVKLTPRYNRTRPMQAVAWKKVQRGYSDETLTLRLRHQSLNISPLAGKK